MPRTTEDLQDYLHAVDLCYLGGAVEGVSIGWSRWRKGGWAGRLGYYNPDKKAIRLCKRLAWDWVPDFYVLHVVHHEALHHVIGRGPRGLKDRWHTEEFRAAEAKFHWLGKALIWEADNAARLACDPPKGVE